MSKLLCCKEYTGATCKKVQRRSIMIKSSRDIFTSFLNQGIFFGSIYLKYRLALLCSGNFIWKDMILRFSADTVCFLSGHPGWHDSDIKRGSFKNNQDQNANWGKLNARFLPIISVNITIYRLILDLSLCGFMDADCTFLTKNYLSHCDVCSVVNSVWYHRSVEGACSFLLNKDSEGNRYPAH